MLKTEAGLQIWLGFESQRTFQGPNAYFSYSNLGYRYTTHSILKTPVLLSLTNCNCIWFCLFPNPDRKLSNLGCLILFSKPQIWTVEHTRSLSRPKSILGRCALCCTCLQSNRGPNGLFLVLGPQMDGSCNNSRHHLVSGVHVPLDSCMIGNQSWMMLTAGCFIVCWKPDSTTGLSALFHTQCSYTDFARPWRGWWGTRPDFLCKCGCRCSESLGIADIRADRYHLTWQLCGYRK